MDQMSSHKPIHLTEMLLGDIYPLDSCPSEPHRVTGKFPALWVLPPQGQSLVDPGFPSPFATVAAPQA